MFNPLNAIFFIIAAPEAPALDDTAEFPSVSGYEDETALPEIGQHVINTISGEIGLVRGIWLNQWTSQYAVNVRVNGLAASWNVALIGMVQS